MRCRITDDAQVVCFVKYAYELCFVLFCFVLIDHRTQHVLLVTPFLQTLAV